MTLQKNTKIIIVVLLVLIGAGVIFWAQNSTIFKGALPKGAIPETEPKEPPPPPLQPPPPAPTPPPPPPQALGIMCELSADSQSLCEFNGCVWDPTNSRRCVSPRNPALNIGSSFSTPRSGSEIPQQVNEPLDFSGPEIIPPTAPSNLRLSNITTNKITLTWRDNSSDETAFVIERRRSNTSIYVEIFRTNPNEVTYTDSNLTSNQRYYYQVKAVRGTFSSAYTAEQNARTLASCAEPNILVNDNCAPPQEEVAATPPPPPPAQRSPVISTGTDATTNSSSCEARGQYTYTGPDRPGVRYYGMCIDCPMSEYVGNGGSCQALTAAAPTPPPPPPTQSQSSTVVVPPPVESSSSLGSTNPPPPLPTPPPPPSTAQPQRAAAPQGGVADTYYTQQPYYYTQDPYAQPTLQQSQRLVRVPEQGNTGPEALMYFAIASSASALTYVFKKRK